MLYGMKNLLISLGLETQKAELFAPLFLLFIIILGSLLFFQLTRRRLLQIIRKATEKTTNSWDDILMHRGVFERMMPLIPLTLILFGMAQALPDRFLFLYRLLFSAIVLVSARAIDAFFQSITEIYHLEKGENSKPIRPFIQTLVIILYIFSAIFVISILLNKSPWQLFGLLGGLTAVTMLVFKDTILGFVAGVQLGANDMVREGDWIEMPKYGADGDVIEVAVNTVKVRNWDKTITTIPTYALISDSFKNWRGMSESDGRRIKRSIYIDMNTVKFADPAMLERFKKIEALKEYLQKKEAEINEENQKRRIDLSSTVVNGRRQTNLGIFRAYLLEYLRAHPSINKNMTFLVRHLQPTPQGLPIEIYVFSSNKVWAEYEAIQADIFDHLLSAIPEFELRVFQQPSGCDVAQLSKILSAS